MTTSPKTNHADEAEETLSSLDGTEQTAATVQAVSALAQVHASLALEAQTARLADAQEVANLIALLAANAGRDDAPIRFMRGVGLPGLCNAIAARLDLTQDVTP